MSTLGIAVTAGTAALACYTLGVWMGRRDVNDYRRGRAAAHQRANRYRLAWLSARHRSVCGFTRAKCPLHGTERRNADA